MTVAELLESEWKLELTHQYLVITLLSHFVCFFARSLRISICKLSHWQVHRHFLEPQACHVDQLQSTSIRVTNLQIPIVLCTKPLFFRNSLLKSVSCKCLQTCHAKPAKRVQAQVADAMNFP